MKAITTCPHCQKTIAVQSFENFSEGEVLFTLCEKCDNTFVLRSERKVLVPYRALPLPRPTGSTLDAKVSEI